MRPRKHRYEWDEVARLDVDHMRKLFDGYCGPIRFDDVQPSIAQIDHDADTDMLRVFYVAPNGMQMQARIQLTRQPCPLGGARAVFKAPCCGRPARRLALLNEGVRCRICGRLTYTSTRRRSGAERMSYKASLIARQLGASAWYQAPAEKPKGMHWRTFERLLERQATIAADVEARLGDNAERVSLLTLLRWL